MLAMPVLTVSKRRNDNCSPCKRIRLGLNKSNNYNILLLRIVKKSYPFKYSLYIYIYSLACLFSNPITYM